ncbi:hypothetical protein [Buttiauxella noackiae]|uniref:hypothetical protein n=1 Tax=Buttiauxella noackiae TaxID=82992 RepID=UPI0028D6B6E8|nr:hypothetical protein [Buttiauxella noackiae]
MKARQKRRGRRTQVSHDEQQTLSRISAQLDRLQSPVNPDILSGINTKLDRIEARFGDISVEATRNGAMAGAVAGGLTGGMVTVAIMLIRAKLGL